MMVLICENTSNIRFGVSAVSGYGTNWRDCIRGDFWFTVVTEGNEDETEITDTTDGYR